MMWNLDRSREAACVAEAVCTRLYQCAQDVDSQQRIKVFSK